MWSVRKPKERFFLLLLFSPLRYQIEDIVNGPDSTTTITNTIIASLSKNKKGQ